MAVIAIMEREFVQKRRQLPTEEFLHAVGLAEILGSFASNAAFFVGYRSYGAVETLISEMEKLAQKNSLTKTVKENLLAALTYFKNHNQMMDYAMHTAKNLPIGSGVTEAACKTLVKQRLCGSGMRWKDQGAKVILSLRALVQSKGRWQQFWDKIDQYGSHVYL
jgi:hypothetical protein